VGVSVRVVEYSGQVVEQVDDDCDVTAVWRTASSDPARYPLLAGVDEHDDTTFNPRQTVMLIAELERLAAATDRLHMSDAVARLIALAELLAPAPRRPHHRRLQFIGD